MEVELLKSLLTGSPVAVLAFAIFWIHIKDRRGTENRLTRLIEADQQSRQANTRALTELVVLLKHMNERGVG